MGLSIVAACLPTLRPLFGDMTPGGLSKFLRTFFTLRSRSRSTLKARDGKSKTLRKSDEVASNSSRVGFAFNPVHQDISTEIYPMRDLEAQAAVPNKNIMVQNRITQISSTH